MIFALLNVADVALTLWLWSYELNPVVIRVGPVVFVLCKAFTVCYVLLIARCLKRLSFPLGRAYLAALSAYYACIAARNVAFALTA